MLTEEVKRLMANLIKPNNIPAYDFCFDERDKVFKLRLFITEVDYLCLLLKEGETKMKLYEYHVNKSYYHPSMHVHYINKYFKKFRCGYNYRCELTIDDFLHVLPKITVNLKEIDGTFRREIYSGYSSIRRATSEY